MQPINQVLANPLYFTGLCELTPLPAEVWVVAKDTTIYETPDFFTIIEAITAAASGDTILVFPGTYEESLAINKPLILYGNGAYDHPYVPGRTGGETIINNQYPVSIQSGSVMLNGFELTGFHTAINIPSAGFIEPDYILSNIILSYNWIHSTEAWAGITSQPGHLDNYTISDSIIDIDKVSPTDPLYALTGIGLNGGATVTPQYSNVTIRNNVLRNSSGFYNIFAESDPAKYTITNLVIECNHFLTRSRAEIEPGMSFNLGNITNGRFVSNVVENISGTIGISTGTIQGNSFINGGALRLWGTEAGFSLPSRDINIINNEFSNEINGTSINLRKGTLANSIKSNYNSFVDSGIAPNPLLNPTQGYLVRNDGIGKHDANNNWWGYPVGPDGNTGKIYGDVVTTPWITRYSEDRTTGNLCWPLSTFRDKQPGFYPRIITGITYTGNTYFETTKCVELSAKVAFIGGIGLGIGIPVTFWLCGRKYSTRTTSGGLAAVNVGSLWHDCYTVTVTAGDHEICTTIHVSCNCPHDGGYGNHGWLGGHCGHCEEFCGDHGYLGGHDRHLREGLCGDHG